jgi:hypothetical protein
LSQDELAEAGLPEDAILVPKPETAIVNKARRSASRSGARSQLSSRSSTMPNAVIAGSCLGREIEKIYLDNFALKPVVTLAVSARARGESRRGMKRQQLATESEKTQRGDSRW